MAYSFQLGFISVVSYLLTTSWQHFSICGLQGVLLGSLQSTKFNFLFATVAGLFLLGKSTPATDGKWQIWASCLCALPLVVVAMFSTFSALSYCASTAASKSIFFEEGAYRWQSVYNALIGPGLLHGWVFIIAFVLISLLCLPGLTSADTVLESNNSSFYPTTSATRLLGVSTLASVGFITGAYWAFFSQAWGNWFNYDPVELVYLLMLFGVFAALHSQNVTQLASYKFLEMVSAFSIFIYSLRFGLLDSKHSVVLSDVPFSSSDGVGLREYLLMVFVCCWCVICVQRAALRKSKTRSTPFVSRNLLHFVAPVKSETLAAIWIAALSSFAALLFLFLVGSSQFNATHIVWFAVWWLTALVVFWYSARTVARHLTAATHKLWSSWHSVFALCAIPFGFLFTYLTFPVFPIASWADTRLPGSSGYSFLLSTELEGAHRFRVGATDSLQNGANAVSEKASSLPIKTNNPIWVEVCGRPLTKRFVHLPLGVTHPAAPFFLKLEQTNLNQLYPLNNHPLLLKMPSVEIYTQANSIEADAIFSCFCWIAAIFACVNAVFL